MTTKLDRMVTYNDENSSIKSLDPLNRWSNEVTSQIKNKTSPLLQGL